MGEVITIGLDIAKNVFQVHCVDGGGAVVIRKRVSRSKVLEFFAGLPSCLVGIEACPSAHHWGRELQSLGHTVKLLPPSYVKAYLKRSKNDANDAAAICEAVTRPSMRFVPLKTREQQAALMLHRTRQLLVCQRTMLSNALRGHLAELGIVSAKGRNGTSELLGIIADAEGHRVPPAARANLEVLARQYRAIAVEIGLIDKSILAWHRTWRISSTRPAASKECTSSVLPCVREAVRLLASVLRRPSRHRQRYRAIPGEISAFAGRYVLRDAVELLGDVVVRPSFGVGPIRGKDVVGAPAQKEIVGLAEQLTDLFAEHWIGTRQRRSPAAELESAGRILFRPAWRLHDAVHRNHCTNDDFPHGSLSLLEPRTNGPIPIRHGSRAARSAQNGAAARGASLIGIKFVVNVPNYATC